MGKVFIVSAEVEVIYMYSCNQCKSANICSFCGTERVNRLVFVGQKLYWPVIEGTKRLNAAPWQLFLLLYILQLPWMVLFIVVMYLTVCFVFFSTVVRLSRGRPLYIYSYRQWYGKTV